MLSRCWEAVCLSGVSEHSNWCPSCSWVMLRPASCGPNPKRAMLTLLADLPPSMASFKLACRELADTRVQPLLSSMTCSRGVRARHHCHASVKMMMDEQAGNVCLQCWVRAAAHLRVDVLVGPVHGQARPLRGSRKLRIRIKNALT